MTTPVIVAPEALTLEHIKTWDGATMKDQMRRPDMRDSIFRVIATKNEADVLAAQAQIEENSQAAVQENIVPQEKTPEELAEEQQRLSAEAEAQRIVTEQETERQAAQAAENEQLKATGITVIRDSNGSITKLIEDYQVKDEHGNSIGRPTHLEARSWPELVAKQKEAHEHATRAFHRLKAQKITFKEQQQPVVTGQLSDVELLAAMKDLKSDDPQKQLEAIRKVQQNDTAKKDAEAAEFRRQEDVSRRFLANHKNDFNNCKANIELVKEFFLENPELAWTDDNLEICLHAIESKLAPVESAAPMVTVNPIPAPVVAPVSPVVAPVTVQPAASLAVQPVATVPAQVALAAANPPAATVRPGVNGGIVPGETSASRPGPAKPKELTAEEIKSWDGPTMRKKMADPRIRPQIEAFIAARQKTRR